MRKTEQSKGKVDPTSDITRRSFFKVAGSGAALLAALNFGVVSTVTQDARAQSIEVGGVKVETMRLTDSVPGLETKEKKFVSKRGETTTT